MSQNLVVRYQQRLKTYYQDVNTDNSEYIGKQNVKEWLELIIKDNQISQNEEIKTIRQQIQGQFDSWVDGYLRKVMNLESQSVSRVQFRYEQCVQFLQWLLRMLLSGDNQQGQQLQEKQNNHDDGQQNDGDNEEYVGNSFQKQNQNKEIEQNRQQLETHHNDGNSDNLISPKITQHAQQPLDTEHQQPTTTIMQKLKPKDTPESQQQLKLPEQDQRYNQYLQTIFQHYCKINFGLTKDNTFDTLQQHASVITINKFMIFVNDFQITALLTASMVKQGKEKMNKVHIRNLLMDVFKKNTLFQKEMNFQQYLTAINKIGQIAFAKMKQLQNPNAQQQPPQKSTQFAYQMIKMIKYMEIFNFKEFKQKMTKLNINFSLKFNKQLQQKKMPINYKFKYELEQNKISQQVSKPPLPTKKIGEQNFNKKLRYHLQRGKPQINSKQSTPNIPPLGGQNVIIRQRKVGSSKNLPSGYNHNTITQNQKKQNNMPSLENANKKGRSVEKRITHTHTSQPIIEGYANIHLAKKGLVLDQNKSSTPGIRKKGEFQLNNVIEEARKQAQTKVYYDYQDERSGGRAISNASSTKPPSQYSQNPISNQSQRNSNHNQENTSQNSSMLQRQGKLNPNALTQLQRSRLDPHNQLKNLIDFNESDQDQYLDQHLQKQKDHDSEAGIRVEKKLSQFNYKM